MVSTYGEVDICWRVNKRVLGPTFAFKDVIFSRPFLYGVS